MLVKTSYLLLKLKGLKLQENYKTLNLNNMYLDIFWEQKVNETKS